VVDNIHPEIRNLPGFDPIDDPLLSLVFQKDLHTPSLPSLEGDIAPKTSRAALQAPFKS